MVSYWEKHDSENITSYNRHNWFKVGNESLILKTHFILFYWIHKENKRKYKITTGETKSLYQLYFTNYIEKSRVILFNFPTCLSWTFDWIQIIGLFPNSAHGIGRLESLPAKAVALNHLLTQNELHWVQEKVSRMYKVALNIK